LLPKYVCHSGGEKVNHPRPRNFGVQTPSAGQGQRARCVTLQSISCVCLRPCLRARHAHVTCSRETKSVKQHYKTAPYLWPARHQTRLFEPFTRFPGQEGFFSLQRRARVSTSTNCLNKQNKTKCHVASAACHESNFSQDPILRTAAPPF
jgi:hypothetical protein